MNTSKTMLVLLALGASVFTLNALTAGEPPRPDGPGGGPGGPEMNGRRPPSPLMLALDANHDGIIDADEIANASTALKTLDKNGDGKLTQDELHPPRPLPNVGPGSGPDHPPVAPPKSP